MVQLWYKNFYFVRSAISLSHALHTILSFVRSFAISLRRTRSKRGIFEFLRRQYFTCSRKCHDCENRGRNLQKFIAPYTVLCPIQMGDLCVHECSHTPRNTPTHVILCHTRKFSLTLYRTLPCVIYKILPSIRHSLKFLCPEDEARATCTYSLGIYLHAC